MELDEEKQLIRSAQKDPEVFGQVYDLYYSKIFGYILKRTANLEAARDICSETFFKAFRKLWQFRWKNVSFSAWLYRIAINEINQYFRKGEYKSVSLDVLVAAGIEPVSREDQERELIEAEEILQRHKDFLRAQKRISRLDKKYQEVLALRFFEKKSIKDIAEILSKPEGTIKSLIHRALKKLQKDMQPFAAPGIVDSERSASLLTK